MWRTLLTVKHCRIREAASLRCICIVSKYFLLAYEFVSSDAGRFLRLVDDILEVTRNLAFGHEKFAALAKLLSCLVVGGPRYLLLLLLKHGYLVTRLHVL